MIRIRDIKLPVTYSDGDILDNIAKILCLDRIYPGNSYPDLSFEIIRRSIDARKKPEIFIVMTVKILIPDDEEKRILKYLSDNAKKPGIKKSLSRIITDPIREYEIPECGTTPLDHPPVVVGAGPAGLFCALLLARRGFCPIVIERGQNVDDRTKSVDTFWKTGKLRTDSNVQFGEGGAGTFSDGKLNTLTKDTNGRNTYVLRTFSEHGAPKDITVDAKPHIGTDILKTTIKSIREEIIALGGTVLFETLFAGIITDRSGMTGIRVRDLITQDERTIDTGICVICIGHSARDTFKMLFDLGVDMSAKSFATGFRIVHPQRLVNIWQYGIEDPVEAGLPPADYKVSNEASNKRRVYSFCMCPGGYVVNASSEDAMLCVNGMSESKRDGKYANSAIIAAITPDDFIQDEVPQGHPLAGMYYQRRLEKLAYSRGCGSVPIQSFVRYEAENTGDQDDTDGEMIDDMADAVKGSVAKADLRGIFSTDIDEAIIESMHKFGYTMKGFDSEAVMLGIESRTSSPVRINRDEDFVSNIKGLYPCGEGAGYAGGIMSAACDGMKCAEKIIERYRFDHG